MPMIRRLLAGLVLAMAASLPVLAQEAVPESLRTVLVLPYLDPDNTLAPEHQFARFTVPDMVRLALLEDQDLVLVEKALLEASDPAMLGSESGRRELSRQLGADHYIWGYLVSSGGKLTVFHHIVDVESGRTVHMKMDSLVADAGIFDALSTSARDFAVWVRQSLPNRLPPPLIIEKQVTVEKPVDRPVLVDRPVALPAADRGALALGGEVLFFLGDLAPYLDWTGGGYLSYQFGKGLIEPFRLGLRVDVTMLRQKSALFGSNIQILNPSLGLVVAWPISLAPGFAFVPRLDAGASVIFGRVNDQLISYARPALGLDLMLRVDFLPEFQAAAGLRGSVVFAAWQTQTMFSLAPILELAIRP